MSGTKSFSPDQVQLYIGTPPDDLEGTMTVLMKTNKYYTDGSLKQSGVSYAVTREWGRTAVEAGWAEDVGNILPVQDTPGLQSFVSEDGIAFANLPLAAAVKGSIFYVNDVGVSGSLWRSNGTTWGLVGGSCVLGQSAVAVSVTAASTAEEVLAQVAIPAGAMGLDGALRVSYLVSVTNNANTKTTRVRLGATALGGSAWVAIANTGVASIDPIPQVIRNRGVANSQVVYVAANGHTAATSGTANSAFTEDTSQAMIVAITGQKATGSDTFTLEGYTLELLRP